VHEERQLTPRYRRDEISTEQIELGEMTRQQSGWPSKKLSKRTASAQALAGKGWHKMLEGN
jgi:hypothetical protein